MAELLSRKEVRAQKSHVCDLCKAKIESGAMYVRTAYKDGGRVYDFKQHIHCDYLADSYCASMGCDEYDNDDVKDWVIDEVCRDCADREDCTTPTLLCPVVIKALLPPTLQTHEEIKRYTKEGTVLWARTHGKIPAIARSAAASSIARSNARPERSGCKRISIGTLSAPLQPGSSTPDRPI